MKKIKTNDYRKMLDGIMIDIKSYNKQFKPILNNNDQLKIDKKLIEWGAKLKGFGQDEIDEIRDKLYRDGHIKDKDGRDVLTFNGLLFSSNGGVQEVTATMPQ